MHLIFSMTVITYKCKKINIHFTEFFILLILDHIFMLAIAQSTDCSIQIKLLRCFKIFFSFFIIIL